MKKLSISELYETLTEVQIRSVLVGTIPMDLKKLLQTNSLKLADLQKYAEEVRKQKYLAEQKAKQEEEKAIQEQLEAEKKAKLLAEAAARQEVIEDDKEEENNVQQEKAIEQVVVVKQEENTAQQVTNNNTQVVQQNVTQVIVQPTNNEVVKRKELTILEIQEANEHLNKLFAKRTKVNEQLKAINNFINQPDSENNKFQLLSADDTYSFKTNSSELIAEVQKVLQKRIDDKLKKLDAEIKAYREANL